MRFIALGHDETFTIGSTLFIKAGCLRAIRERDGKRFTVAPWTKIRSFRPVKKATLKEVADFSISGAATGRVGDPVNFSSGCGTCAQSPSDLGDCGCKCDSTCNGCVPEKADVHEG